MSRYNCPKCGSPTVSTLYQCPTCGHIYCGNCHSKNSDLPTGATCPKCGTYGKAYDGDEEIKRLLRIDD